MDGEAFYEEENTHFDKSNNTAPLMYVELLARELSIDMAT